MFNRGDIIMVVNNGGTYNTYQKAFDYFMEGRGYHFKYMDLPKENKAYVFVKEGVHDISLKPIYFISDIDTKQVFIMEPRVVEEYEEPIKEGDKVLFELDEDARQSLACSGDLFGISINILLDLVNKEYTVVEFEEDRNGNKGVWVRETCFVLPLEHLKKV